MPVVTVEFRPYGDPMATTNYLEFASSADAKSDASARADLVKTGSELRTQTPFSQLGTFKVSQDGDLVVIKSDWSTGGRAAVSAELTGGGPAACLPAS